MTDPQTAAPGTTGAPGARKVGGPVLDIRNLTVDYGYGDDRVRALRGVDLTLHEGEVLGLAGESGCGKSTLVYAATRLLPPPGLISAGQVLYHPGDGAEPVDIIRQPESELRAARWRDTAIVFQGAMNSLNPLFRVGRQLTDTIAAHRPEWSRAERDGRARELLTMVGISPDRVRSYPHQLSGGMRQRVMVAMALALEPRVLIMDEPTTALDVVMQRQIVEQIARAAREARVLGDLHHPRRLACSSRSPTGSPSCTRARSSRTPRPTTCIGEPRHPYSQGLLHSFPPLHGPKRELEGIPGTPPDFRHLPTGCPFAPRCRYAFEPCGELDPGLGETGFGESGRLVACHLHDHGAALLPADLAVRG